MQIERLSLAHFRSYADAVIHPAAGGHEIYNIGDSDPVGLMDMITTLEAALGVEAVKILRPMQPGDVPATYADVSALPVLRASSRPCTPLAARSPAPWASM